MRFDARLAPWLLGAAFLLLAINRLGAAPIVGDDEAREVGIVEDVLAGHWWRPLFNGQLIPDKPVLFHWAAALACAAGGFSEFAVRLPSAIAGAAVVGWTTRFGMLELGPPAGVTAGILLATMPAFFDRARLARPDMLMLLLLAAALGHAWRARRDDGRRDATIALALLGLAICVKGPVAPALALVTLVLFHAWERDLHGLRTYVTLPGALAAAVLGGAWYVVALAGWRGEFVRQHLLGRYVGNVVGGLGDVRTYGSRSLLFHLAYYPLHLLGIALPWTPIAVVAAWRFLQQRPTTPLARFLLCWSIAPVLVFTPAEYKLRYYLLPSLPPLALLAAPVAAAWLASRPTPRATQSALLGAAALLVAGAGACWVLLAHPGLLARSDRTTVAALVAAAPGGAPTIAATAGALLGILAAIVALRLWGPLVALGAVLAVAWLALGAPRVAAQESDAFRTFARVARERFPDRLAFYGDPVRSIVVYAGGPVPSLDRRPAAIEDGLGVIATDAAWRALARDGRVGERLATATGRLGNLDQGTLVLATGRAPR